jgi:5'-3' exoribonuclease 2
MGVPALFRWLSQKYPKIISSVIEERPSEVDGQEIPVDTTGPNPNGEEMDNLYLDMNGIVHPCSHPEDRPPPATEEEMMLEVFKYTERVVNMVRPRKLLMIAVGMLKQSERNGHSDVGMRLVVIVSSATVAVPTEIHTRTGV